MTVQGGNVSHRRWKTYGWMAFLVLIAGLPACRRRSYVEPPSTYPVTGQIVQTGGRPVERVLIQFAPANQEFTSRGIIDAEGKFSLRMLFGEEQLEGAIEGDHSVTLYYPPDMAAESKSGLGTIRLKAPLAVKPGDNHFEISLPNIKK